MNWWVFFCVAESIYASQLRDTSQDSLQPSPISQPAFSLFQSQTHDQVQAATLASFDGHSSVLQPVAFSTKVAPVKSVSSAGTLLLEMQQPRDGMSDPANDPVYLPVPLPPAPSSASETSTPFAERLSSFIQESYQPLKILSRIEDPSQAANPSYFPSPLVLPLPSEERVPGVKILSVPTVSATGPATDLNANPIRNQDAEPVSRIRGLDN